MSEPRRTYQVLRIKIRGASNSARASARSFADMYNNLTQLSG